jgi:hypothetical protein
MKKVEKSLGALMLNFLQNMENYYSILTEMHRLVQQGIDKRELLLEMSFCPENGKCAPALRDPPEFKVAQTRHYFEGSRPQEPNWFGKGRDCYEGCLLPWLQDLKGHYQAITNDALLVIARSPTQEMMIRPVLLVANGVSKFSSQTLDAFDRATRGDMSELESVFGTDHDITLFIKAKLARQTGSDIESVTDALAEIKASDNK